MGQHGFYFNMNNCTGCKCCAIACKEKNDLEVGYNYRKVTYYEGNTFPQVWSATLSIGCNHCALPACYAACPVGAITKDGETGLLKINEDVCIGCESCVSACPYGVPVYFPDTAVAGKCDGCQDLLALGETPACVAGCSTRCLDFGDMEDLNQKYGSANLVKDVQGLPDSSSTNPSILIAPRKEMA